MTKGELIDQIKFVLNLNDGQVDQDFTSTRLNQVLAMAYREEVARAKQEGSSAWFKRYQDIIWPASQETYALPAAVSQHNIIRIEDITGGLAGLNLTIRQTGATGGPFWAQDSTINWGTTAGPASDRTWRIYYVAIAEDIASQSDAYVPTLIPPEHHALLVWASAVLLREIGDEAAPQAWYRRRDDLRADYHKLISRGRVFADADNVTMRDSDPDGGYYGL